MVRLWLFLAFACLGCADPAQRRLEGRWFGDSLLNVDAAFLAAATGWVRGTSFEFTGSHVTVSIPTELPRTGRYDVVDSGERNVTIAVQRSDGQRDLASFTFVKMDQMRWHIGDGRAVILRRTE